MRVLKELPPNLRGVPFIYQFDDNACETQLQVSTAGLAAKPLQALQVIYKCDGAAYVNQLHESSAGFAANSYSGASARVLLIQFMKCSETK